MNRKTFLALCLVAAGAALLLKPVPGPVYAVLPRTTLALPVAEGRTHSIMAEVASTPDQLRDGLMFRQSMEADAGMLFVFPVVQVTSFWMKNTLIPLDMVFIRADGRIAKVHANAQPNDETGVPSGEPVKAVLELNGSRAAQLGLVVGEKIGNLPWLGGSTPQP